MQSIKKLTELRQAATRQKYPTVPDHALPKRKFTDSTANGLTKSILSWLELHGHYCSRIQSQGQYNPTLKQWTKSTVRRGIADIMTIINGKTVMIEVKMKDKLSKWQIETKKEVEASGGIYIVCHSFDEFITWYKQNNISGLNCPLL